MKDLNRFWVEPCGSIDFGLETCEYNPVWQMPKHGSTLPYKVHLKNLDGEWLVSTGVFWSVV